MTTTARSTTGGPDNRRPNYRRAKTWWTPDGAFATGPDDRSRLVRHYSLEHGFAEAGDYDPDCAICWLGFSHTLAYHHQQLATHAARTTDHQSNDDGDPVDGDPVEREGRS